MSLKTKLIAGIVAILALFGVFAFTQMDSAKKEEIKQQEEQEKVLFEENTAAIKKYIVRDSDKSIEFVKEGVNWVIVGAEDAELIQLSIDQAIATLRTLYYRGVVENGMERAEEFGLTNGVTDEAYDENGNLIYKITVGNMTLDGTGFYATVDENDPNVYIINAGHGKALNHKTDSFRDKYPSYIDYANIAYMNVDVPGGLNYSIVPSNEAIISEGYGEFIIKDYYSFDIPALTDPVSTNVGGPVYEITAIDFIDYPDENFDYGFDNPTAIFSMEDTYGNTCQITVGKLCEDNDDKYYASFSGKNYYCTVSAAKVNGIINTKPFDLIGKYFFNNTISDISGVNVAEDGFEGNIAFNADRTVININDKEMTIEQFGQLYQNLLDITIDGEVKGEYGEKEAEIVISLMDGTSLDFKFYEYDDNFYAVERNGVVEFVTSHRNIEKVLELLKGI